MWMRRTNRGLNISNRIALLAMLVLALTAVAGATGALPQAGTSGTDTVEARVEPAAQPAQSVAGKSRFGLLLLRRG